MDERGSALLDAVLPRRTFVVISCLGGRPLIYQGGGKFRNIKVFQKILPLGALTALKYSTDPNATDPNPTDPNPTDPEFTDFNPTGPHAMDPNLTSLSLKLLALKLPGRLW